MYTSVLLFYGKVFIHDVDSHKAYKRGKAIERQDRLGVYLPGEWYTNADHIQPTYCCCYRNNTVALCFTGDLLL